MTPFIASLTSALALCGICTYLYFAYNERFMAIWAGAWALWVLRYLYGSITGVDFWVPTDVVLPLLTIGRSLFMLWGAYEVVKRKMPWGWYVVLAADLAWLAAEALRGEPILVFGQSGLSHYTLFAAALIWAGVVFLQGMHARAERFIAGTALMVFGALQFTFPLLGIMPEWYRSASFGLAHATQITIGLAVLLAFNRQTRDESIRLHEELNAALTKALRGHIPICSHCRSIKGAEGDWQSLERYVAAETEAELSHGVCPGCFDTHYGAYLDDTPSPPRAAHATGD